MERDRYRSVVSYRYDELGNVLALHQEESYPDHDEPIIEDQTYSYECW